MAVLMAAVVALGVSAQNLYIFGSFNGWDPANSIEMWQENGVYVMEEIEFGAGGNFALATIHFVLATKLSVVLLFQPLCRATLVLSFSHKHCWAMAG